MKAQVKPCFLLFALVLGIYVMRNSDVSFGSTVKNSLRVLAQIRPSQTLCTATTISEAFSDAQIQRAQSIKEGLQSMRGGNPLLTMIVGNKVNNVVEEYLLPLIQYIAPWPVLFVISILTFFILCCNWCCIYGCCKNCCKCCKCCKAPKTAGRKRIYVALSVLFLLATFGVSIAGIVVSAQISTGLEVTLCSIIATVEHLEYGVMEKKWMGVQGAADSLQDVVNHIDGAISSLSSSSNTMSNVDTKLADVKSQLSTMITTVNGLTKPRRAAPDQSPSTTYTPYYGAKIGPATDNTTFTGAIQQESQTRRDLLNTAKPIIDNAVTTLKTPPSIKSAIQTGQNSVQKVSDSLQDVLKSLNDYGSIGKDALKGVSSGLTGVFIANLVIAIFTIGSIVMVGCMKAKFFNKFLLSNAFLTIALTILGWLLATVFYPLSLVMMETCDVLDNVVKTKSVGDLIMGNTLKNGDITQIYDICMFGNGDMIAKFGLTNSLKDLDAIFDQFEAIEANMPISATTAPASIVIPAQQTAIANWLSGMTPDADETITDLTALNQAVNKGSNACTNIQDTWQLNSGVCTTAMGVKFLTTSADTYDKPNPTCIGLEAWFPTSPVHTIANRYTATEFPSSCSNRGGMPALTYAQNFITKFKDNRSDVKTYFNGVTTALNSVNTKYTDFANAMKTILTDFSNVKSALASVRDALIGPSKGLLNNMRCNFFGDDLRTMTDAMCIGFIASIYQSSVVIIVTSVFTFLSAIFMFCLGKRFILPETAGKAKPT